MQRDITALRADNLILKDRVGALEEAGEGYADADDSSDDGDGESRPADTSDRPTLKVVTLTPETAPDANGVEMNGAASDASAEPLEIVGNAKGVRQQNAAAPGVNRRRAPSLMRQ